MAELNGHDLSVTETAVPPAVLDSTFERLLHGLAPDQPAVEVPADAADGGLAFYVVPQAELAEWWPKVRDALDAVIRKTRPSWIPEQIYHVLAMGHAWLNLTLWDGDVVGMSIVCRDGDQFAGRTDALILAAWSDPKNLQRGIEADVSAFTQRNIEERCRAAGFRYLRMHSPRKGWLSGKRIGKQKNDQGLAERLGYRVQDVVYVKALG